MKTNTCNCNPNVLHLTLSGLDVLVYDIDIIPVFALVLFIIFYTVARKAIPARARLGCQKQRLKINV